MEFIQNWVGSIAAATMIIAAAAALCPKNSAGRAVGLIGSIIMTAVLVAPVKSFDLSMLSEYTAQYEQAAMEKAESFLEENRNMRESIIEENVRAYILQRAGEMGITCDVQVTCREDVPYSAHIVADSEAGVGTVTKLIESELGIPKSRRTYKIEV